jgi:hypothetical protein
MQNDRRTEDEAHSRFSQFCERAQKILLGAHIAFMCFVRISEQRASLSYTALTDWFCVTEVQSVYCAVRTESLYETDAFC